MQRVYNGTVNEITALLAANTDMRSIAGSEEAVKLVLHGPFASADLIDAVKTGDKHVRARAMDALQKIAAKKPSAVEQHIPDLLTWIADISQQEVQWHVAQILPLYTLTVSQQQRAAVIYRNYLTSPSTIVKTWALDALVKLAQANNDYVPEAEQALNDALIHGSPAMKARARALADSLPPDVLAI